jgi:hypothetical protein
MNRPIKFRVWDLNDLSMWRWKDMLKIPINVFFENYKTDRFILMQYTGLKDKNGKEIYESDLLKWKGGRITEVTWHKYTASFDCIAHNSNGVPRPLSDRVDLYAEIIGNMEETERSAQEHD